jgi:hypothetical protein
MKFIVTSLILLAFGLMFFTYIVLAGQTRTFESEVNVQIIGKEKRIKVIGTRRMKQEVESEYFQVKDENGRIFEIESNDKSYELYQTNDRLSVIKEKNIFGTRFFELKDDYNQRQIDINTPENYWIGKGLLLLLIICYYYVIKFLIGLFQVWRRARELEK